MSVNIIFYRAYVDLVRSWCKTPNRISYTCTCMYVMNALKIHRAEMAQAELTQGRLDSGPTWLQAELTRYPFGFRQRFFIN